MHHPEGMLEPGVYAPGIDHLTQSELSDSPKSLEYRMVENIPFPLADADETVYRVSDFVWEIHAVLCLCFLSVKFSDLCYPRKGIQSPPLTPSSSTGSTSRETRRAEWCTALAATASSASARSFFPVL